MKRIIFLLIILSCSVVWADRIILQYRDKGIEITVKIIEDSNEPTEPNEPIPEPNEPIPEPNQVSMGWKTPSSLDDPNNGWSGESESKIIDGDPNTYGVCTTKNQPLILSLAQYSDSNACRVYMRSASRSWKVDVFYDGSWHNAYEGGIVPGWFTIYYDPNNPEKTQSVISARIFQTGGSSNGSIREFEFFVSGPNEPTEPNLPPISSNIRLIKTQGQLFANIEAQNKSRIDNNFRWWIARYEKGWETYPPPWYLRERVDAYLNP